MIKIILNNLEAPSGSLNVEVQVPGREGKVFFLSESDLRSFRMAPTDVVEGMALEYASDIFGVQAFSIKWKNDRQGAI